MTFNYEIPRYFILYWQVSPWHRSLNWKSCGQSYKTELVNSYDIGYQIMTVVWFVFNSVCRWRL